MYNGFYCTYVTLSFGLQNGTRYICNMRQLINDWQCQQSFDDAVLIPELNHKTALHHDCPAYPTNSGECVFLFFF